MTTQNPADQDPIRPFVDNCAALHAGTPERDQQALLDREHPHRQCTAATLIAERLLADVTIEMVEPDLAPDRTVDPTDVVSAEDFTIQVSGHVPDILDDRKDLPRVARLKTH